MCFLSQLVVRLLLCLQLVAQLGDRDVGTGHGCGPGRTRIGAVTIVRRVRQLLVHPYAFQGRLQRHNGAGLARCARVERPWLLTRTGCGPWALAGHTSRCYYQGMEPNLHDLVTRLLAEEAHLIGQEVQDASNKRDLDRLAVVSGELDGLADLFRGRRPRPRTHG